MLFKASDGGKKHISYLLLPKISVFLSCTSERNLFFFPLPGSFSHIETKVHGATFDRAPHIAHGIYLIRKKGFSLVYPKDPSCCPYIPTCTRQVPPQHHCTQPPLFYSRPTHRPHAVLTGEATRGVRIRGWRVVLLIGGQLHSLLVHSLGLHPLDETEEVLIRHCGGMLACLWRRATLVIDSGRLQQKLRWEDYYCHEEKFH